MNYELGIRISGRVIHGEKYGRKLGFPTANIDRRSYSRRRLKVRLGVYAGSAGYWLNAKSCKLYKAAVIIGPIDNRGLPKIEAHLLNFEGNLYGQKIIIILQKYIRPFRKFLNEQELKKQIRKDLMLIKKIADGK